MANNLPDLLEKDIDALDFYYSLPPFIQHQIMTRPNGIQTMEDLSSIAKKSMHDALLLDQYKPMLEDETGSEIDYQ